jgi:DNA-directed RNA polymerase sigma subunit (sigma70/sigma32)
MPLRSPLRAGLRKPTLYTFGEPELVDLDDRTAHVLRMRSGMLDGRLYKLSEVGEEIGVSGERARQIQSQGLSRIRQFREAQRHMRDEPKVRRGRHSGSRS